MHGPGGRSCRCLLCVVLRLLAWSEAARCQVSGEDVNEGDGDDVGGPMAEVENTEHASRQRVWPATSEVSKALHPATLTAQLGAESSEPWHLRE